ncbi:hypothetical protein XPA_008369 [Xanthoria parietina]
MTKSTSQQKVPKVFQMPPLGSLDLYEVTIKDLQQYMSSGQLSSHGYVTYCLERIRVVNPYLEAVIEVNPDALAIAKKLDEERQRGIVRSTLHGIPVLVKDVRNASVLTLSKTDGSRTSPRMIGCKRLPALGLCWAARSRRMPTSPDDVSRLRDAGAVILGHTNMSEWASVRSSQFSSGYSPRGGQCRNAFDLSKSPYGSSSGSAVAVSANIVPISFGTETDASIIGPAEVNGIVGIKPTVGLTSRTRVIPISRNMDSVGVLGRTVADAVHGLDIIAGKDQEDPMTHDRSNDKITYSNSLASENSPEREQSLGCPGPVAGNALPPSEKRLHYKPSRLSRTRALRLSALISPVPKDSHRPGRQLGLETR